MLVSDEGYSGLVIRMRNTGIILNETRGNDIFVTAFAGETWDKFVSYTVKNGWYGLENLSGIPGSVGAAPIQNIGAYGAEVKDSIEYVTVYDSENFCQKNLTREECGFGYRESFFKTEQAKQLIVISVTFRLRLRSQLLFQYKDIAEYLNRKGIGHDKIGLSGTRKAVLEIRARKLPSLSRHGTAGSFFKNPIIEKSVAERLRKGFPEIPFYEESGGIKVPAAYLIDRICNLKAAYCGGASIYKKHGLVIVSNEGCKARDVNELAKKISKKVFEICGVVLTPEVKSVGNFI